MKPARCVLCGLPTWRRLTARLGVCVKCEDAPKRLAIVALALLLTGCAVLGRPTAYRVHEGRGEVLLSDPWGRK